MQYKIVKHAFHLKNNKHLIHCAVNILIFSKLLSKQNKSVLQQNCLKSNIYVS